MATLLTPQDNINMQQAQWQEMFNALVGNGVVQGQLGSYVVTTTSGLTVSVASGRATIQGFLARSDAAVPLTCATADPTNPRIDRAVLHADLSAHTLSVILLTGTPAPSPAPPTLTQTATVWEISLYQVRVNATQTVLTSGSLTDERSFSGLVSKGGDTMTGNLTLPSALLFSSGADVDFSTAAPPGLNLRTAQSGAANFFKFTGWNGSTFVTPFGVGSASTGQVSTYVDDTGKLALLAGQATAGSFGVPNIVAQALRTAVAVTTLVTILTYTIPANGTYRVNPSLRLGATSGTSAPHFYMTFTDAGGTAQNASFAGLSPAGSTTMVALNGSSTFAANWGMEPMMPYVGDINAGTLTVFYQTTGTPSDTVSVVIERLA